MITSLKEIGQLVTDTIKNGRSAHIAVIALLVCTLISPGVLTLLIFKPDLFWHGDLWRIFLFCVAPASASATAFSSVIYITMAMEQRSEKSTLTSWFAGAALAAFIWHGSLVYSLIGHDAIHDLRGLARLIICLHFAFLLAFVTTALWDRLKRRWMRPRQVNPQDESSEIAHEAQTPQPPAI